MQFRILTLSPAPLNTLYVDGDYCRGLSAPGLAAVAAVDTMLRTCPWRLPTLAEVCAVHAELYP